MDSDLADSGCFEPKGDDVWDLCSLSLVLLRLRADGTILWANKGCRALVGRAPHAMADRPWTDWIHPEDRAAFRAMLEQVRDGTANWASAECRVLVESGTFWFEWEASPARDEAGEPVTLGVAGRDVTRRRLTEESLRASERRLSLLMEATVDGFWEMDVATGEVTWSERVFDLLGVPTMPSGREMVRDWVHGDDREAVELARARHLEQGAPYCVEYRIRRSDGRWLWILERGRALRDSSGRPTRFVGSLSDVSGRRRAQVRLETARRTLERIVEGGALHDVIAFLLQTVETSDDSVWAFLVLLDSSGSAVVDIVAPPARHAEAMRVVGPLGPLDPASPWAACVRRGRITWGDVAAAGREDLWCEPVMLPGGRVVATVCLMRRAYVPPPEDVRETAENVARLAGLAIARVRSEEAVEEGRQRFEAMFRATPAGVFLFDPASENPPGRILDCNEAAAAMNGYEREELIGKGIADLTGRSVSSAWMLDWFETVRQRGISRGTGVHRRKDGRTFWVEYAGSVVRVEGRELLLGVDVDITHRIESERALVAARDAAEAAARAKDEFLAIMSHELRTPLNAVLGFADLLAQAGLPHEEKGFAEMIRISGKRLKAMIDDVLEFSRLQAATPDLRPERFDPRAWLDELVHMFQPEAEAARIRVEGRVDDAVPNRVVQDPERLRQIATNLLANAVKFTAEGTITVRLAARAGAGRDIDLELHVADTGIGIPPEMRERVFEPFQQVDSSRTRKHGGAGLGLAICRKLAGLLGGTVSVESELGRGSTFTVAVPAKRADAAAAVGPLTSESFAGRHPHRILVVAADEAASRAVERSLGKLGFIPSLVDSAHAAAEAIRSEPFTLVLVDERVPAFEGIAQARDGWRARGRPTEVIALGGWSGRPWALESGWNFDDRVADIAAPGALMLAIAAAG